MTPGVIRTRVGYAGGIKENPTYHSLGNHTETIQLDYNPNIISYKELLNIFWMSHTPQYKSPSRQYMSLIFYHNEEQRKIAYETKEQEEKRKDLIIYTEIIELPKFYLAENYHQKYYLQLVRELMNEFQDIYPNFMDFINSTAAAHVNGYIKGYGTIERLKKEIDHLGLTEKAKNRLVQIVEGFGR